MEQKLGCVVMAAGNGARFAANKLLEPFRGRPLIAYALEAVPQAERTVVVTQYAQVAGMARRRGFEVVQNTHPERGASYSVRLGVRALQDCDAILFLVADQPLLGRTSVERLVAAWRQTPDAIIAAARDGVPGNPCLFPRAFFDDLKALRGDIGGKAVVHKNRDRLRTVELPPQELADCDTPEDLRELEGSV